MALSGNDDTFQQRLAHVMNNLYLRGAILRDPFFAIADRDRLVSQHTEYLENRSEHDEEDATSTHHNIMAPNRAYPIIPNLDGVNMINIRDILETGPNHVHTGKFFLCRTIVPPEKLDAVHTLVEDPVDAKRALRLELYNYCLDDMAVGTMFAIMHPWVKKMADGLASIVVQNPSHIKVLVGTESVLHGIVWATPGTSTKPKATPAPSGGATSNPAIRNDPAFEGNELFARKEYTKALDAYSRSIEKHPAMSKLHLLYSNRGLTYLRLGRPFEALKDLDAGLKMDPNDEKLIYRKCKALLALRRFPDAGQFLHESIGRLKHLTKNKEIKAVINDLNRLKPEYECGQYDLIKMIDEAKKSKLLDNHADYFAWNKIEIRNIDIDGKGRGLFAKDKIEAGELLIACKAFVFVENETEDSMEDLTNRRMDEVCFASMVEKICKKLMDRPDVAEEFYRLYAGPELGHLEKWTEGESNLIDIDRIESIVRLNHMGTDVDISVSTNNGGVWLVPSYINHSCVDTNSIHYFVGDFMFVRATKSIEKGEEILFPYVRASESFETRQLICRDLFDFECQCRLCVMDRRDPIEILRAIDKIRKFMDTLDEGTDLLGRVPCDIPTLKNLLRESLDLRPQRELNYLAIRVHRALAARMTRVNKNELHRLIEEIIEVYKSNGEFLEALSIVKMMHEASRAEECGRENKWKMEARRIAKLIYGDERMAGL